MDQISVFVPVLTPERFAALSGLDLGVIEGHIEKGHLPSIKIGRRRLVNIAALQEAAVRAAPSVVSRRVIYKKRSSMGGAPLQIEGGL